jgi:hypothetical protein
MYSAPQEFIDQLQTAFDGRLRIRWSVASNEFHIEQRVARGMVNFPLVDGNDDERIRLKDGYFYVMSIRNGDRMPCPKCGGTLQVPLRQIRELSCGSCRTRGYEHRVSAGYFPLDDTLITYLRMIDPLRGASKELRNKIDKHNADFTDAQRQKVLDQATAAGHDDFNRIAGIPQIGYGGNPILPGTSLPGF